MRTSAWSYPDSCWQTFARTFQTYQMALRKPCVTSPWRRSSPESSHLKNRYELKHILGSMLESYGSCMSKSYIIPGGFDQTASSHNLRERGGLEERSTGSCGNPAGDGSEVRLSFSLGTNWSSLFRWLVYVVLMIFSDFTDSTMWTINWTLTLKSLVCIWRTTTQFRLRPTSTERLYFRMNPPMNSCRFTTRCTTSWAMYKMHSVQ